MAAQLARLERNYEGLVSDFQALNYANQDEALINAFNAVPNCLPATKDAYRFITPLAAGPDKDKPTIPAMLVPAMLGMGYTESNDVENFKNRFLRKHGKEGENWKFMNKRDLFSQTFNLDRLEIPVPGRPGETIVFSKDAGNRAKWPFITPRFARWLLTHTTKPVSKQLIDFYFEVHDAARRLKQAIDAGYVTLKRKILDPDEVAERPDKRLKTAAASAALMSMTIDKVDGTGKTMVCNRYLGPRIHDALNVAICGHTRNEKRWAELS